MTEEQGFKIDEETGLPELPEGQFWRVAPWGQDAVRLEVVDQREISQEIDWTRLENSGDSLKEAVHRADSPGRLRRPQSVSWSEPFGRVTRSRNSIETCVETDRKSEQVTVDRGWFLKPETKTVWFARGFKTNRPERQVMVSPAFTPSESAVRAAARDLLKRIEAERAAGEEMRRLVGDYPPKKVEVADDDD